jgi:hypothetical protein
MSSSLCIKRLWTLAFVSAGLICGNTAEAGGSSTPTFTSGNSNQVLTVGHAYTYQVSATPTPIFTATGLPPGLVMSSIGVINGTPTASGSYTATITASNDTLSVQEMGMGAHESVNISSSTLGNNIDTYAGAISVQFNGVTGVGFCIDPWHYSLNGVQTFNWESLATGPKMADGMGVSTALEIEQLWDKYYSSTMSNSTAAGLQIAIWDLVTAAISAQTGGADWYTLNIGNDYGASAMISFVQTNPTLPAANLAAVTGAGQDYVTLASNVPSTPIATSTQTLPFTVYAVPVVTSTGSATIPVGQPYSYTIAATNSPTSYSASSLPSGLTVSTSSGVISGTPTHTGTYTIPVSASNPGGSGSGTLTLNVATAYTLTIGGSPSSGGSATGAGVYASGTVVTISEASNTGYRTNGWSGTDVGSVASPSSATTTITMNSNKSLTASYVQRVSLAINTATGGTATGAGTYDVGTSVPIVETASTGYRTNGWSGSGSIVSPTSASTSIVLNSSATITPAFVQQVTLAINTATGGTATGAGTYDVGTSVPIVETASTGYRTNGWSGSSSIASPSSASTSIVLNSSATITPAFVQRVTLAINTATGGTATGAGTYDVGTSVPIVETASTGYRTNGWSGSGSIVSPTSASTSIVLNSSATITPAFVQQVSLTVTSGTGGTATGSGTFDIGSTAPIAATPASGYSFADWTGASPASASSGSTTITLTGNLMVAANFTPLPPSAIINAAATAYTGSPFSVTSTASAPADNLTLHSIEWLSPSGTWTVSSVAASGGTSNRSLGINFPTTGTYTLRAGVSDDNGTTWFYSPTTQVAVSNGITTYTLETMAVPGSASLLSWYAPSPVVQKTYEVQHVNP